jgi:7-carboxy-7-deazaguanine synthase
VEVTGGEPLLQPETIHLLDRLIAVPYEVLLETNGSMDIGSIPSGVTRIVDIKTPGSGMAGHNLLNNLECVTGNDEVKFVISDRHDYDWAVNVVHERDLAGRTTVLFSPAHGLLEARRLAEWIIDDRLDVRLNLQLHRVIWPERDRGV